MSENYNRIIVGKVLSHYDFLKMFAAFNRKCNPAFFVHDINRTESPTINLECLFVPCCRVAIAKIHRIGLNYIAVRNLRLKFLNHITRQDVWTILFSSMKFNADFAINISVNHIVKFNEMISINFICEVNFSRCTLSAIFDQFTANDRSLSGKFDRFAFCCLSGSKIAGSCNCCRSCQFEKVSSVNIHYNSHSNYLISMSSYCGLPILRSLIAVS